jgi:hypothetical protein
VNHGDRLGQSATAEGDHPATSPGLSSAEGEPDHRPLAEAEQVDRGRIDTVPLDDLANEPAQTSRAPARPRADR